MSVDIEAIRVAHGVLGDKIILSPCAYSQTLSKITGAHVVVKFENLQFTASFKERGACVKLEALTEAQRSVGVIAMSAGNHAQGVAYHSRRMGIAATIVMPKTTPNVKIEHTRALGANVVLFGQGLEEAAAHMRELAAERSLTIIHPYDDAQVIAGQGTVALEMLSQEPGLDALILPIGGGGLLAGCATAAKAISPQTKIYGVQAQQFPAMKQRLAGEPVSCGPSTIAEGIAVKNPGAITQAIIQRMVDDIFVVDEDRLEQAVLLLLEVEKTVAEGAGAAGLAALIQHREQFAGKRVGLVITGGNLDMALLSSIITRGLARSDRLCRLMVTVSDMPGSLARVTAKLFELEANVVEVHHHRAFTSIPLKSVDVEVVLQTRGTAHLQAILAGLEAAGLVAKRLAPG